MDVVLRASSRSRGRSRIVVAIWTTVPAAPTIAGERVRPSGTAMRQASSSDRTSPLSVSGSYLAGVDLQPRGVRGEGGREETPGGLTLPICAANGGISRPRERESPAGAGLSEHSPV